MIWRLLFWYLLILLLGWVTFPISYRLFARLPDRGYALSRILGLLLWGFGFWLLASLRLLQNQPGGIVFALALLIGCSFWAGRGKWEEIWAWLRRHWRLVLVAEAVFLIGFAFMALVRASDPDATGTEKPMELAFINAILRSETFPPHDPWLSGYAISYYHFGYILAAMVAKVTMTSGGVAFNLMLAAVFGMSAVGAYGVLYNLLAVFGKTDKPHVSNIVWSLIGPLFLLFVSNLEAVLEMLHQAGVGWDLATGTSRFWEWVNINALRNPPSPPLTPIPHRFWWWWQASRVIHDIDLLGNVSGLSPIDEFPAFSFVLGDLHPHILAIPFVMLLVGLSLNIYRGAMAKNIKVLSITIPYRLDLFILSAITLGGIAFLNTWDLPVYFVLLVGAYGLEWFERQGWGRQSLIALLTLAVPLGVSSLLLYLPFLISFQSQAGGVLPNLIYPTRGFYLWVMFGPLFIPMLLMFLWLNRKKVKADWGWGMILAIALILFLYLVSIWLSLGWARTPQAQQVIASQGETTYGGFLLSAVRHRLQFGVTLLTLAGLLGSGFAFLSVLVRKGQENTSTQSPIPFVILMVVLGGLMVLGPEFIYLRDHFGTRMNTVFKFYYQAWMLWSLAAGFGAVVLLKNGSWFSRSMVLVFTILGLAYPLLAFPAKTGDFSPVHEYTLDASAYMRRNQPDEATVINWLSQAPVGALAEAVGGQYTSFARVSTLSGQPSVLGWPGHQGQWRGGYDEVGSREGDIRQLYETADWETTLNIIRQYDITYIYVGSLELGTYAVNTPKLEQNLAIGYGQGGVKVYVVPQLLKE